MILGTLEIGNGVLNTHNDSYALSPNTNLSVLRPYRAPGIVVGALLSTFGFGFYDLLLPAELFGIAVCATAIFLFGNTFAHLVIINRELRGSDLSVAVIGTYGHLNRIRREIAQSLNPAHRGDRT